jgi:hypothetical protein
MVTRDAAAILKWDKAIGTLEAGKRADLFVIGGKAGDPYEALIKARETAIRLVMINGVARYGMPALMARLGPQGEAWRVGGLARRLFLGHTTGDPDVAEVSLAAACKALTKALHDLPRLAADLERPRPVMATRKLALDAAAPVVWSLALDEIQETAVALRPRLPFNSPDDFTGPARVTMKAAAAKPLSAILQGIELDPLTVADDRRFLARIEAQPNVPEPVRMGLAGLYR